MPREDLNVTVNGTPLSHIGYWGDVTMTHRYPYGSWEMSWSMDMRINQRHPDVARGARVVAWVGPTPIWRGTLTEPDFDGQEFTATGVAREAETALSLGFGVITTAPSVAVAWGILRGALSWRGLNSLPSTPLTSNDDSTQYNYIADLLDAWSLEESVHWVVTPDGFIRTGAAPTTPLLYVTPGAGILGVADEEYVSDLYGRYYVKPGKLASVSVSDDTQNVGTVERGVDLSARGVLTEAQAEAILDGLLAQGRARTGWTNGVEVGFGQVTTTGGTPIALSQVARLCGTGAMARLLGLFDERGASASTDIVVGESIWRVSDGTITLNPVGLAARDFSSIVEAAGGVLL